MVTVGQRPAFRQRLGLGLCYFLIVLSTLSSALQLGRPSSRSNSAPRKYRLLDQEEESTRRRLGIAIPPMFWNKDKSSNAKPQKSDLHKDFASLLPSMLKPSKKEKPRVITNVHQLHQAVLDDGLDLSEIENASEEATLQAHQLFDHDVIQLLASRYHSQSTPGNRNDDAKLALAIEGGGMRGAVSAGMAAAVGCLGLSNAFDAIYGASAGSVIGAYMVSRQMCVDVYTDILPAAQRLFVCKKRLVASLAVSAVDIMLKRLSVREFGKTTNPGMNISFVLDGIMDEQHGLRPLDLEAFRSNNVKQPLRVASSAVSNGRLESLCFGSNEFFNQTGLRSGLFSCLQAGMTVPGATGPPVSLLHNDTTKACFDAFCFEPMPYRSAVKEGATHVLVLRSRPEGFVAKTKPGVYEKAVTPLYFKTHGEPKVAEFFEKGGQQYIYLEDILTLEEGKNAGVTNHDRDGVQVPPPDILYGVDDSDKALKNRETWQRAHILPVTVPKGTPELPSLEQDKGEVLSAVRGGFAAAFDLLAPAIGLDLSEGMTGARVAELVFPYVNADFEEVLETPLTVMGNPISHHKHDKSPPRRRKLNAVLRFARRRGQRVKSLFSRNKQQDTLKSIMGGSVVKEPLVRCHQHDAETLLERLPGIQPSQIPHLAQGLRYNSKERV